MAPPLDRSALAATFKAEAEEHLAKLTRGLLQLEKSPPQPALIEELFRAAHTLKGASRMMGYLAIQGLAHQLEDLFDRIKRREMNVSVPLITEMLKALDAIALAIPAAIRSGPVPPEVAVVSQALKPFGGEAAAAASPTPPVEPPAVGGGGLEGGMSPHRGSTGAGAEPPLEEYVRIPLSRINALLNLVGELVIHNVKSSYRLGAIKRLTKDMKAAHRRLAQAAEQATRHALTSTDGAKALAPVVQQCAEDATRIKQEIGVLSDRVAEEIAHLDPVITELHLKVKELRMLPCATIFEGCERLVRDIATQERKSVQLIVEGAETELDKKVLEAVKPCLIHLLRNAVDHGIELPAERERQGKPRAGMIRLQASQQGDKVVIDVEDDGRGLDLPRIKEVALKQGVATEPMLQQMDEQQLSHLIFAPGFSTSPIITDISGRGVGLDVVRQEVERLKGHVHVVSTPGAGLRVSVQLPLTVAIMRVLIVEAGGQRWGVPLLSVEETVPVALSSLQTVEQRLAMELRGRTIPVVRLADALGLPPGLAHGTGEAQEQPVVIAHSLEQRVGFLVNRVIGEEEIFLKSLGSHLGKVSQVSGAAILATGEVIVILEAAQLIASAKSPQAGAAGITSSLGSPARAPRRILIAEDSLVIRELERTILETQGYEVETAVDGADALEKLGQRKFDLLLSDVQMPRMDGFELCLAVRKQPALRELPVVFVTSLSREAEKRRGIEVGAQAYIVKGAFDQRTLLQAISRLLP